SPVVTLGKVGMLLQPTITPPQQGADICFGLGAIKSAGVVAPVEYADKVVCGHGLLLSRVVAADKGSGGDHATANLVRPHGDQQILITIAILNDRRLPRHASAADLYHLEQHMPC